MTVSIWRLIQCRVEQASRVLVELPDQRQDGSLLARLHGNVFLVAGLRRHEHVYDTEARVALPRRDLQKWHLDQ